MEAPDAPPLRDGRRPPGSPQRDLDVLRDDLAKIASQTIVEIRSVGSKIEAACREESSRGAEQIRQTFEELQTMKHGLQTLAETVENHCVNASNMHSNARVMSRLANVITGGGKSDCRHSAGKKVDKHVHKGSRHTLTAAELKQKAAMKERVAGLPPRQETGKQAEVGSKFTPGGKRQPHVNAFPSESDSGEEEEDNRESAIAPMPQEEPRWKPSRPRGFEERPFTPQDAPALLLNQEGAAAPRLVSRGAWCETGNNLRATAAKVADDRDSLPNVTVRESSPARAPAESDDSQRSSEQSVLAAWPRNNLHRVSTGRPVPLKTHTLLGDGLKVENENAMNRPGSFNSDTEQGDRQKRSSRAAHARMTLRLELRKAKSQIKLKTDHTTGRLSLGSNDSSGAERISSFRRRASRLLHSNRFDNSISLMIMLNAVTIGFETDICASEVHDGRGTCEDPNVVWRVFEVYFCAVFSIELALRMYVKRGRFLLDRKWGVLWNWFDFVVVMTQLAQEAINVLSSSKVLDVKSFRVIRVLRILRVVRIFRLVRVLHLISELRTIVSSILGSFKSLAWTAVLLFLMIYIVSVFFTQTITDHVAGEPQETLSEDRQNLKYFYGSLAKTILALWQSITGGADWDQMARPMIHEVSPMMGLAFCAYIAFAILALMNVVTGVFVQTALQSAQKEEDSFLTDQIVSLFQMAKGDKSARITLDEIQQKVNDPAAAKEWKSINVSADEANYLFELLDIDQSNDVYFEEFLSACIRLRGPAKSIDTLTMMQEARARNRQWQITFEEMQRLITGVLQNQEYLCQLVELRGSKDIEALEARTRYIEAIMLNQVSSGSTGSLPELPGVEGVLKGEEV